MMNTPFYNPTLTYEDNYAGGPFGFEKFTDSSNVILPFGIPAGPLLNGKYCAAAFNAGYDICVYKTVRASAHPCNEFPNVLYVHPQTQNLTFAEADKGALTDNLEPESIELLNISNSFGVPSYNPDIWQADIANLLLTGKKMGQTLVGSFQGTNNGGIQSFVDAAHLLVEAGVKVLEMNTSCPNEGKNSLLCYDPEQVGQITKAVKEEIGDIPLHIKIAYLREGNTENIDNELLDNLLKNTIQTGTCQGISSINTIPTKLINAQGEPALPGTGRESSGVCGAGIKWAGLAMTKALAKRREELGFTPKEFTITGVGGVLNAKDYLEYRKAGADEVLSATGAMWNPGLAIEVKEELKLY